MRKLENLFGQMADSFFCVYSVPQPSVCDFVLTAGGVSHLRNCQNWVLMVTYPCTVLLEKCQMSTKCFQTSGIHIAVMVV